MDSRYSFFPFVQYPGQFFQVHTCKSKPRFHFHPGSPYVLCITKSMLFLGCSENPLDCFLS